MLIDFFAHEKGTFVRLDYFIFNGFIRLDILKAPAHKLSTGCVVTAIWSFYDLNYVLIHMSSFLEYIMKAVS